MLKKPRATLTETLLLLIRGAITESSLTVEAFLLVKP